MKKKIVSIVLALLLFPTVAFAGTPSEQIKVTKNAATILVNGQQINSDNFIYNGTTYVPLRAISENMNSKVDWNNSTKTASIASLVQSGTVAGNSPELFKMIDNMYWSSCLIQEIDKIQTVTDVSASGVYETDGISANDTLQLLRSTSDLATTILVDLKSMESILLDTDISEIYKDVLDNAVKAQALVDTLIKGQISSTDLTSSEAMNIALGISLSTNADKKLLLDVINECYGDYLSSDY